MLHCSSLILEKKLLELTHYTVGIVMVFLFVLAPSFGSTLFILIDCYFDCLLHLFLVQQLHTQCFASPIFLFSYLSLLKNLFKTW
jgi:hypothetical protein